MKVAVCHPAHYCLFDNTMSQVLKKYPEKTIAKDLLKELEAFQGDPNNILLSRTPHLPQFVSQSVLTTIIRFL